MLVRRLIYISTINLLSKRAQSIQVKRFVKSLSELSKKEGIDFKAFSLGQVPNKYKIYFKARNKNLSNNRLLNNLYMVYYLFKNKHLKLRDSLYSRDLLLLFIFALLGFNAIYEFHHPSPPLNSILLKLFNLLPNTRIITISNALKKFVLENYCFYSKEILVLPSAVEIKKYNETPKKELCRYEVGMESNKYYILHTGSPYKGRGIEKFVELCKVSSDIFFIHIGGTIEELEWLKFIAIKEDISNCLFLPNIDEELIIKYQKGADLLFYIITNNYPTFWCCSPLKIPEYMASGTPILASEIGAIPEIIDSNTAFLFDPYKSLKDILINAKSNPKLASNIALMARKKVEKLYTWSVRSKLLISFLKDTFQ